MRGKLGIIMVIAVMCPSGNYAWGISSVSAGAKTATLVAGAQSVEELIERLESLSPFAADINYEVSLAMTDADVVYDLSVASNANPEDQHYGQNYLIDWSLTHNDETNRGFSAYFDGHCYRYRDNRLQEYHFDWDSIPFVAGDGGVQANGQFVDLLPYGIASQLRVMSASDNFTVGYEPRSRRNGRDVSILTASQNVNGYVGRNFRLVVDCETCMPLFIENEYNPAQISEQTVRATYNYSDSPKIEAVEDEEHLIALYPDVFENFRENNYRIENIRGLPLPGFSLPTPTGERYTRQRGDSFTSPTVVAILSADNAAAPLTVKALRQAAASMPREVGLIFVFIGSHIESIEGVTGALREGEVVLMSGKSLARNCGTSVYPTVLVAGSDGVVADVILGFNNSLADDVIQSLSLTK